MPARVVQLPTNQFCSLRPKAAQFRSVTLNSTVRYLSRSIREVIFTP